jgi:predicted hotdog family 3-hydroxylacyl-ACP dehydratase
MNDPSWEIVDLIPHRGSMNLIERIAEVGEDRLSADLIVNENDPFFESGAGVPAWVGLEYMAQAAAALAGARAMNKNRPVRPGFIVSCREYISKVSVFEPGSRLRVTVRALSPDILGTSSFACAIVDLERDSASLVEGRLTVFEPETGDDASDG